MQPEAPRRNTQFEVRRPVVPALRAFGNGVTLASFVVDAGLPLADFEQRHGAAFLLCDSVQSAVATGALSTLNGTTADTSNVVVGVFSDSTVFPLVRRTDSRFEFVSVGRHENNDVYLPAQSVSRFHAFFKTQGRDFLVQDCNSQNGSQLDGIAVLRQREGQPVLVAAGAQIAFGDVRTTFLTAAMLIELLARLTR
ncbi:MAG: FHA domain-containing protein [Deltaproteobacteria bacterium]|nr:FHA domain-containing protein [Deltaproteobacteria bacterium]